MPEGKEQGADNWEFEISIYKLLYIKWINNRVLHYIRGNNILYPVINYSGKEYAKVYIYVFIYIYYIIESLCSIPETITTL